ncbi:methyl-CpG-binding domain protein 1 isoform X20 [Peromyscus maniculatus bairdii]|uniref:methyl-CpG-binding domain protein 1 isoform X20 n=1 Tax=Peromyscus maniculatus bairdii TaxID=230844 RepID=UPI003FD67D99
MAEDWQDCPALGPGWKRREAFRKSGASCGRSDIYYQSPTGEKIRSKVELTRYLGPACDLTLFNFRQGILCYPVPKTHPLPAPNKKKKKPSKPAKAKKRQVGPQKSEVRKETPRKGRKAGAGAAAGSGAAAGAAPASLPALGCCENCGIRLSRDCIKRQRLKALCKDCRAQRIAFNREQRMFRRVGCGECTACLVKEDCGACSICRLQLPHDVASELFCKCERRRCLRIVEKDKRDRRKSGSKVAARRHSRAQPLPPRPASQHPEPTELHISDLAPTSPAEFIYYCVDEDELQPYTNHHRQNRKCGACAACLRRMDCGHCDFCCDKPKFGGSNQKRQKCRWRQCLQFAMKRLLPSTGPGSEEGAGLPPCRPCRKRPGSPRRRLRLSSPSKAPLAVLTTPPGPARASAKQQAGRGFVLPPPDTDFVFLQEGAASPVQVPGPAAASSEAPLQEAQSWGVAMPQVKQEKTDAPEEWTSGTGFPTSALQPGYPSKALDSDLPPVKQEPPGPAEDREENREDYVSESAPEEEAGGVGTPVITEIFSLGGTRLRDAAAWLPRSKDLKNPEAKMQ